MRKLTIFFAALIFALTNHSTANAQFGDDLTGGFNSTTTGLDWEDWAMTCGTTWECNWAWLYPDVMEQMLNPPPGHSVWPETGLAAADIVTCGGQTYALPTGFVVASLSNPYDPYMINTTTGEVRLTPWYAESTEHFTDDFDWTSYWATLGFISFGSVGTANMAQFQAWTLPAGTGLAALVNGPELYPEGWEPPGC